jgi:hypothetical protein
MRRALATVLGTGLLLCVAPPALAADGDPATGYWAKTRTGLPVPVEPLEPVPEGGTWVAADPTGPVAVSALRTELAPGLVAVELRLTVADALGAPAVQACPSTDRWAPEQGGRLEGAPPADCAAPLEAKLDGEVLVVPLPPGLDAVNVLLRPAPGSAFSLTMERATAASVVTAPAPSTAVPLPAVPPPPAAFAEPPSFVTAPLALPVAEPASAPLLAAAPVLPVPAPTMPAPAPQTAPAPVAAAVAAARPGVPEGRPGSLLATAVLALVGAQAVRLARRPATAPRALGGSARRTRPTPVQVVLTAPQTRGVGRFRTARATPPVRL